MNIVPISNGVMEITALLVFKCAPETCDPIIVAQAYNLSQFGYFYSRIAASNVKEFVTFVGRTVATKTPPGQRQTVTHEVYKVHAYNRSGLCAIGFMDDHYPVRSAFSLLTQVLDEYPIWSCAIKDSSQECQYLKEAIQKFQDPAATDKLLKIQKELDETKIILHKTIDGILDRGEKLDSLVDKSSELSNASKEFYKRAQRTNSCCTIL